MSKKLLIILSIVAFIAVTTFSVVTILIRNYKSPKELELTYQKSAGVPFKWTYTIEDPTIVECSKVYVLKDENKGGVVGAPIYNNYVFKGLKEGVTHVTFKYVSITDKDYEDKVETHTIKVDKNLNISLVGELKNENN